MVLLPYRRLPLLFESQQAPPLLLRTCVADGFFPKWWVVLTREPVVRLRSLMAEQVINHYCWFKSNRRFYGENVQVGINVEVVISLLVGCLQDCVNVYKVATYIETYPLSRHLNSLLRVPKLDAESG